MTQAVKRFIHVIICIVFCSYGYAEVMQDGEVLKEGDGFVRVKITQTGVYLNRSGG